MRELKYYPACITTSKGKFLFPNVYLKSEADKVIEELKDIDSKNRSAYYKDLAMMAKDVEHQKYKRCLAMAEMCKARYVVEDVRVNSHCASWDYTESKEMKYWERWRKRWLELADKFKDKEAK